MTPTDPQFSPGLVKTALAEVLQPLINQAIAWDTLQGEAFLPCAEKVVQTSFRDLGLSVFWTFHPNPDHVPDQNPAGEFVVQTHLMGEADAHIQTDFLSWLKKGPEQGTSTQTLLGDKALARQFLTALGGLSIDWEEQLSHLTGDLIAHQAGEAVRGAREQTRSLQEKAWTTLREYLQFELKLLPLPHEVTQFETDVNELAQRVDALTHRVEALMADQMQPHIQP
ncbi:SCP2 domain-containing protein [Thiomicrospira sp. WB1]|uniref:ubiquinone biosynthesis accessory factor UbiJ n=1 Tax=Thiomicrospira sp. WB1 TaxID=1685380 RepID=UPI0007486C15|nr:hypothetical protein [Thiomicrospira sp. WB1]KUJ72681.1 hypothetical protein AVO41_02450 [Thiomicrospira sp. WB1]